MCCGAWKMPLIGGIIFSTRSKAFRPLSTVPVELRRNPEGTKQNRGHHGGSVDWIFDHLVRTRRDSREALQRDEKRGQFFLQPAAQDVRLAPEAAVHLPER